MAAAFRRDAYWGGLVRVQKYRRADRDEWVVSLLLLETFKVDFLIRIQAPFLLISNQPWSDRPATSPTEELGPAAAALTISPRAMQHSLWSGFASFMEARRKSELRNLAHLYPWLVAGRCTVEQALARHARALGFAPRFASGDRLLWRDGDLWSESFGSLDEARQPVWNGERSFGLFPDLDRFSVELQFEADGLRSRMRWTTR
jgi:hypothetical protein